MFNALCKELKPLYEVINGKDTTGPSYSIKEDDEVKEFKMEFEEPNIGGLKIEEEISTVEITMWKCPVCKNINDISKPVCICG